MKKVNIQNDLASRQRIEQLSLYDIPGFLNESNEKENAESEEVLEQTNNESTEDTKTSKRRRAAKGDV